MAEEETSLGTPTENLPVPDIKPDTRPSLFSRFTHSRIGRIGTRIAAVPGLITLGMFGLSENAQARNMIDPYGVTPNDTLQSTDYVAPPNQTALEENNVVVPTSASTTAEVKPSPPALPTSKPPSEVVGVEGSTQNETLYKLTEGPIWGDGFSIVFNGDTRKFDITIRNQASFDKYVADNHINVASLPINSIRHITQPPQKH